MEAASPGTLGARRRGWYAAAALAAAAVAVVFATVGDGVDVAADGWAALLIDHGHTAVWVVLAAALGTAAVAGRWQRASGTLAGTALVIYGLFLIAVLTNS